MEWGLGYPIIHPLNYNDIVIQLYCFCTLGFYVYLDVHHNCHRTVARVITVMHFVVLEGFFVVFASVDKLVKGKSPVCVAVIVSMFGK